MISKSYPIVSVLNRRLVLLSQSAKRYGVRSNKATVKQLAFIAAILVVIASAIGLYIAYDDLTTGENEEVII